MVIYSRVLIVFSSHNLLLLHPYLLALRPLHCTHQIGYIVGGPMRAAINYPAREGATADAH